MMKNSAPVPTVLLRSGFCWPSRMQRVNMKRNSVAVLLTRGFTLGVLLVACSNLGASELDQSTITPQSFVRRLITIAEHGDLWDSHFVGNELNIQFTGELVSIPNQSIVRVHFQPIINERWPVFFDKDLSYSIVKVPESVQLRARLSIRIRTEQLCIRLSDLPPDIRNKGRRNTPTPSHSGALNVREAPDYGWEFRFQGVNNVRLMLIFRWKECVQEISILQNID